MASALLYGAGTQAQTVTASRLIASAVSEHNSAVFVLRDSSYLTYTNDRGGDLEHEMKFDKKNDLLFNTGTGTYRPNYRTSQTFDAQSNLLTNMQEMYNAASSSWTNVSNMIYTYNGMNNMETSIAQYWNNSSGQWENSEKSLYFYNGDNTLDTTINQQWNGEWINYNMTINSYDIDGNLAIATSFYWTGTDWTNSSRTLYNYTNNMVSSEVYQYWNSFNSNWINYRQTQYTYNGAGKMTTTVLGYWNSSTGTFMNSSKTTNTYNANDDIETMLYQYWSSGTGTWQNSSNVVYTHDTAHNAIAQVDQNWNFSNNAFVNTTRFRRTFNQHNQMTTETSQRWNLGGFWENLSGDTYSRYYYQTYTLGVAVLNSSIDDVLLYPVPATNMMTVATSFKQPQAFTVAITDMMGRVVRQWSESATADYKKMIPTSDLSAGNYILQIKCGGDRTVKQFTVAH